MEERRFSAASPGKNDSSALAPVASDAATLRAFVEAGRRLAEIHVHYEQQPEYPLEKVEKKGEKLDYRVTKMKLSKDKTILNLQPIPKPNQYSQGNLRVPPRQSLRPRVGYRPISGLNRQAQRHHQRSKSSR